ncbi:MAG: ferredoxin oxidoreductase, partial [Candidatus Verstraetearchaeota archaeon]|nr:ferredoxin oxidoreductase [Candidatus Verstraetearchaeota archaeon]
MTGTHFMLGNYAVVEGALVAGCNFFAGYPITPANEISERMAARMP